MVTGDKTALAGASLPDRASPYILLAALLGIPGAGWVALVLAVQFPRLVYGQASPLLLAAELGSLATVLVLVLLLRAQLAGPSAPPRGFYRDILDFLAISRWHPAVKAALVGLIVLPIAWYSRNQHPLIATFRALGWRRALEFTDIQNELDGLAAIYQLALTGGVPLLFALHMLSRRKPKNRILPWLLVPFLFVATGIGVVLLVAILHH